MAGTLVHAREFQVEWYGAADNRHYEVVPVEGEYEGMSHTTWWDLRAYCESHGVPREVWPHFANDSCDAIDIPLDRVAAMQAPFREALERLPPEVVAGRPKLAAILGYLRAGEQVFFC